MITDLDVKVAASIISKYYRVAQESKKEKAILELEKIMHVMNELYTIAKNHKELDENPTIE